ncbi:VWA domain-containing protein [Mobilitalea sibirica]|uniref:VWA domain-containing protein n=2 Tax=Mobilitalea sibirica TaxID=1462919 RepID=A0A8J7H073_9FIRM|nr:VWA domain-containing protein [Mobilitalea sibirica]
MIGDSYKMTDSSAILNSVERDKAYGYQYDGLYPNTEEYTKIFEKGFMDTLQSPLSTFSIDVDTASYANIRKNINYGLLPEMDAVRIEEMLNYFNYEYDEPTGKNPFSINTEIGRCPWNQDNYLLMVGVQGKDVDKATLPKSNLVFLIDVSGSMDQEDKLPLLKNAFSQLVEQLTEDDRVSIVVYASKSGVVLDSVPGNEKRIILSALKDLTAGGSTAGAGGIEKAYALAQENFIAGGNNRVILATDGDFNVGPSSPKELEELIEQKRESGIFLSVLGFGMGNIKDNRMELLADKGNGNYAYIDSSMEAKKVLVDEMSGTLLTIAKDVKIQLEFNPYSVESYRLIGYENRALNNEDFKNDKVDAGELGAGHSVTAIYEIVPNRKDSLLYGRESLKYQTKEQVINKEYQDEITEVRLRYKLPDSNKSNEILQVVSYDNTPVNKIYLSEDFYFAAAVAEFGMLLRNSEYKGTSSIENLLMLAEKGLGKDEDGYRTEFINLVEKYEELINNRW